MKPGLIHFITQVMINARSIPVTIYIYRTRCIFDVI